MTQNFKDPMGLAWRMLRSGNATARSVLLREFSGLALKPFDWLLSPLERRRLRKLKDAERPNDPTPMLLMVGGPRSGTTIAYQLLVAHLPVSYTSCWVDAFAHSPITAGRLRRRWVLDPPDTRENFFGSVRGMSGPSDAFAIWNRWFGEVRGVPDPLTDEAEADMRSFFWAWHQTFGRPLLNKNNRNTLAVTQLAQTLPAARFIVIRRNPIHVVQSLIVSRREVQGDVNAGWGLLSRDADPDKPMDYVDVVCEQVHEFQTELDRQLATVDPARVMNLNYRELCANPEQAIRDAFRLLWPGDTELAVPRIEPLTHTDRDRLSKAEVDRIQDWFAIRNATGPNPNPTVPPVAPPIGKPVVKSLDAIARQPSGSQPGP